MLRNPRRLEQEHEGRGSSTDASLERVETLKAQRLKLRHAVERLIDGFTEGLIEKEQFTRRMDKTKSRITDLDARIKADAGDVGHVESLRLAMKRLLELSAVVGPDLAAADWHRRREIIRTLVQRIEIDRETIKVIFRLTQSARGSDDDSIAITLQRP
jgi:site-specific DNA recombinase